MSRRRARRGARMARCAAWAVCAGVVASHGAVFAQQRTRHAVTGPVTREVIVRSLSVVPDGAPDAPGEASVLLQIEFRFDSAELVGSARRDLDRVAEALADPRLVDAPVVVEGHTDATGDAAYNRRLSRRRAAAVVTYLAQRGVAPSRLASVGFGEERLLAEYAPTDGRQRRVEIVRSR